MGAFEIISIIISVLAAAGSMAAQAHANEQNIEFANQNREDTQEYNSQEALIANERAKENYYELYSPAAKKQQLRDAGMSVGLFYGNGGTGGSSASAPQASAGATSAPVIQPILQAGMMSEIMNLVKTMNDSQRVENETKKNEKELSNLDATYDSIIANTKNTEAQTELTQTRKDLEKVQKDIAEIQLKYQDLKELKNLELLQEQLSKTIVEADEVIERTRGISIENDSKNDLIELQKREMAAKISNVIADTILKNKQALTEEAKKKMTEKQYNLFEAQIKELEATTAKLGLEKDLLTIERSFGAANELLGIIGKILKLL